MVCWKHALNLPAASNSRDCMVEGKDSADEASTVNIKPFAP